MFVRHLLAAVHDNASFELYSAHVPCHNCGMLQLDVHGVPYRRLEQLAELQFAREGIHLRYNVSVYCEAWVLGAAGAQPRRVAAGDAQPDVAEILDRAF